MKKTSRFRSDPDVSFQSLIPLSDFFFMTLISSLSASCFSYKRTSETLSQASQKATAAFSNMGSAISRKLEDVR